MYVLTTEEYRLLNLLHYHQNRQEFDWDKIISRGTIQKMTIERLLRANLIEVDETSSQIQLKITEQGELQLRYKYHKDLIEDIEQETQVIIKAEKVNKLKDSFRMLKAFGLLFGFLFSITGLLYKDKEAIYISYFGIIIILIYMTVNLFKKLIKKRKAV